MNRIRKIEKVLSINDLGINGTHQAGMLIPKKKEILEFLPELDGGKKNPRVIIEFEDDLGRFWNFNYIYYNNRFFGGTRNEYRLTGMTAYFRAASLQPDDTIILSRDPGGYHIAYRREADSFIEDGDIVRITLGNSWTIIDV